MKEGREAVIDSDRVRYKRTMQKRPISSTITLYSSLEGQEIPMFRPSRGIVSSVDFVSLSYPYTDPGDLAG
jgi:hypothetical protein